MQKSQKIKSKTVNRRTDNTMHKRRRTDNTMHKRRRTDNTMHKRKRTTV
jgi:hypothetical protein